MQCVGSTIMRPTRFEIASAGIIKWTLLIWLEFEL